MANQEHLDILKQGLIHWGIWREKNPEIRPDLSGVNFHYANLSGAILEGVDLSGSGLYCADLSRTVLCNVNLSRADLNHADLSNTVLWDAVLCDANLYQATLSHASLKRADISRASLIEANLNRADLQDANLTEALIQWTIFADNDLSATRGLESIRHLGPSTVSIETLVNSGGNIPESFLRGCGVPDNFITFAKSLVGKAIEYYSAFISYSSKNQPFAERLYIDLQSKGVRCWFAPEDLKIGEKIRVGIDESIRMHDKLLLVLSKHSVESGWVEKEVETAMEQERKQKRTVLFPVMLDNSVMKIESGWPADIRRSRNMGDFRKWKDHDSYSKAFERLLRDLKAEDKA